MKSFVINSLKFGEAIALKAGMKSDAQAQGKMTDPRFSFPPKQLPPVKFS